jgi:hypothetical protein
MSPSEKRLTRAQLLAAEIFGYSFQNYEDHLGIGHVRYERMMPDEAVLLERAVREQWPLAKVATALETSEENAEHLLNRYHRAIAVIDAENPAESFRNAVRFVIQDAVSDGLSDEAAIEKLVTQICYRASDLGYLLKLRGEYLSRYSERLRKEPGVEYVGPLDEDDG